MPDDTGWSIDATRAVVSGAYYRFGVAAASTVTDDQIIGALAQQGWTPRSISAPPPEIAAALQGLTALGLKSWYVHATWTGEATTIPDSAAPLFYGPLEQYNGTATQTETSSPGPAPTDLPATLPSPAPPASSGVHPMLAFVGGGLLVALIAWAAGARR